MDTNKVLYWSGVPQSIRKSLEGGLRPHHFAGQILIDDVPKGSVQHILEVTFHQGRRRFGQDLERLQAALLPENKRELFVGQYILEQERRRLRSIEDGQSDIILTDRETEILVYLAQADGQSISRDDLLHSVWGYNHLVETHTLETHIYRLRQKLELDPSQPAFLLTTEEGYCLKS